MSYNKTNVSIRTRTAQQRYTIQNELLFNRRNHQVLRHPFDYYNPLILKSDISVDLKIKGFLII